MLTESDKQKLRTDALDLFAHLRSTSSSSNQRAGNNRTGSSGRDPRPKNTLPPYNTEVTLAYAAALLPTLYAATVHVLSEAAKRLGPAGFRPSTVLDFGSGLSSAAWAAQNAWPESLQRYIGFDEAKPMHWLASDLLPPLDVSTKLHRLDFLDADILSYVPRQFASQSVALAAYTLSEITHPKKRAKLVQRLWDTGAEVVVLIDRGTPSGFSYIAQARAQLLELASKADAQGGHVVAPCPHDKACPLRFSKDFCHFAQRRASLLFLSYLSILCTSTETFTCSVGRFAVERPGFLRATKHSSRGDEDASFSYVVFQRSPRPSPTTATSHSASGTKGGPLDRPTDMRTELVEGLPEQGTRQFDVLPLDPGPLSHTGETATEAMQLESSTWPRLVAPPLKRSGHIILDACAASGALGFRSCVYNVLRAESLLSRQNRAIHDTQKSRQAGVCGRQKSQMGRCVRCLTSVYCSVKILSFTIFGAHRLISPRIEAWCACSTTRGSPIGTTAC